MSENEEKKNLIDHKIDNFNNEEDINNFINNNENNLNDLIDIFLI